MKVGQPYQTVVGNLTVVDPVSDGHTRLFTCGTPCPWRPAACSPPGGPARRCPRWRWTARATCASICHPGRTCCGTRLGWGPRSGPMRPSGGQIPGRRAACPRAGRWWSTPGRPTARCWRRSRSWMFSSPGTQGPSRATPTATARQMSRRWRRSTTSRRGSGRPTWPSCGQTASVGCACTPRPPPTSSGTRSSRPMCSWPTCRSGTSTPGSRRVPPPNNAGHRLDPNDPSKVVRIPCGCPQGDRAGQPHGARRHQPRPHKVYPCAEGPGSVATSASNFGSGQTVPNAVLARADVNGDICVRATDWAHIVWDQSVETSSLPVYSDPAPRRSIPARSSGRPAVA